MAKNRIKGITVEIGLDSSDLQKGLKEIDSSLKTTQANLKDINKLLKLDPGNTELLKQKQENLNKAIKDTDSRLKSLKDAYKNIDGNASEEAKQQQQALAREIAETEQNLKSLKEQYKDFGSVANQQLKNVGEKVQQVGQNIADVGGKMTTTVTAPIVAGFALAADKASDYEENINKMQVAFGDYADQVQAFTDNASMDFGLSKLDASANASAFGALAKGIGLADESAADMAVELTKLSADLGSYFNTDVETSAKALEGIFTGNAQSLKQFGVVMTDTNLKEFAEELGMTAKQYNNLGSEEKTMLRFQYVMAQTSDAQGDYARTSEGTANSIKSLQAQITDLATTLGTELLPIITPVIQKITEFVSKIANADPKMKKLAVIIGLVAAAIGPLLLVIGNLVKGVGLVIKTLGFFTTPAGVVVLAIGAIIAAGVALYKNWDTIKEKLGNLVAKLKSDFDQMKAAVEEKINAMKAKVEEFKNKLLDLYNNSIIKKIVDLFTKGGSITVNTLGSGSMGSGTNVLNSGGMMAGGLTVYNSFTINGDQLSTSNLVRIADVITERVNENLGRMI